MQHESFKEYWESSLLRLRAVEGGLWMTLTWRQPLETVSHAQTQMRCPCRLLTRSTRKRVWASCRLSKGTLWTEIQLKWISDSHQDVWGHDHEEHVRTEQETHSCGRPQLPWDAKNGGQDWPKCSTSLRLLAPKFTLKSWRPKSMAGKRTLVLLLKQHHTHYYQFYDKGTTMPMVGLQGLHMSDAFCQCSNVSASLGLKSFCP